MNQTKIVALSAAAAAAVFLAIAISPLSWAKGTSGGLIGESLINSPEDAFAYADIAMEEARRIWDEHPSGWEATAQVNVNPEGGLIVEARRVTEGPFATSGVLLTRARATLDPSKLGHGNHTADTVFRFLVSPEGYQVIDPISDIEEFSKFIERYPGWKGHLLGEGGEEQASPENETRLETADAYVNLGVLRRNFVVLNAIDGRERTMVSKSVLHKDRPGSSIYYSGPDNVQYGTPDAKQVRALNTFGLRVKWADDLISVEMINWADISLHSSMMNWVNCKFFFGGVFGRLKLALDAK